MFLYSVSNGVSGLDDSDPTSDCDVDRTWVDGLRRNKIGQTKSSKGNGAEQKHFDLLKNESY